MLTRLLSPLVHLFYPHCCELCGNDLPPADEILCLSCHNSLPATNFHKYAANPVATLFSGRLPVDNAVAVYYYSQSSGLQQLIHQFKYKQRRDIATWLGKQSGLLLRESPWMAGIELIIPVPLFPQKERQRGYNQAALLADGIALVTGKPVLKQGLTRQQYTGSQTKKSRISRWENVKDVFRANQALVSGKQVLLVDDVITTGATTEAAGQALRLAGARVSICCLAYAFS